MKKNSIYGRMKRSAAWLAALLLIVSLSACGKESGPRFIVDSTVPADRPAVGIDAKLEPYVLPWYRDAAAESVKNKTLDFYFMSDHNAVRDHAEELGITEEYWGDSTAIFFPNGEVMVLDTGGEQYAPLLVQNLQYLGVETIDYLVFSHPHSDHAFAAFADNGIFAEFEVKRVFCNGILNQSWSDMDRIENCARQEGAEYTVWGAGDAMEIGDVQIRILAPDKNVQGEVFLGDEKVNATSLVMRFDYNESSALFVGDLYEAQERIVIDTCGETLDVDLLKIPHHGKNTSGSEAFLNAVTPTVAVAMGDIKMARPAYYRYVKLGTRVYTDCTDGYVHAYTDGRQFSVITSHERNTDLYQDYDNIAAKVRGEQ